MILSNNINDLAEKPIKSNTYLDLLQQKVENPKNTIKNEDLSN
jgi:hypothetical protein